MAPNNSQVRLPFGISQDSGELLHISKVESGLACNCRCPGCNCRLVAHKGKKLSHHFKHYQAEECAHGLETAIHRYAKELLEREKRIFLPEVVARHKTLTHQLSQAKSFVFDSVTIEKSIGDIRPDVIIRKNDVDLLVEFAVTHFCDDDKVEKIKEHGTSAIEIDLSKIEDQPDLNALDIDIISNAPRVWLFNRKIEESRERLKLEYQAKKDLENEAAEIKNKQRERIRKKQVLESQRKLAALIQAAEKYSKPPFSETNDSPTSLDFMNRVSKVNLSKYADIPIIGDWCFKVEPRIWQSALIDALLLAPIRNRKGYLVFDTKLALDWAQNRNFVYPEFSRYISAIDELEVKKYVPEFQSPFNSINQYLLSLRRSGLLELRKRNIGGKIKSAWSITEELHFSLEQNGGKSFF